MSRLTHKCRCTEHAFDRSWFDQVKETVDCVATATADRDPNALIPVLSKSDNPTVWATCTHIEHAWHPSLVRRFKLHPVIDAMLAYRPDSVAQLVLEWPHVSESDSNLLAYTRDDAKGHADVQTITSIGKYVARHWPLLPDHIRRDVCSLYTPDKCSFVPATVEDFIDAVQQGPTSCMQDTFDVHPYSVYDPALGWGMAVRFNGISLDGRALTYIDPDDKECKKFVRTYSRTASNGYSQADEVLAAWLVSQGYTRVTGWSDCEVSVIMHKGEYVMPYLDGHSQEADMLAGGKTFCITNNGDFKCSSTNGYAEDESENSIGECEDCGSRINEGDEYSHVGQHGDCMVCQDCCDNHYTYVTGQSSRGYIREYYVRDDSVVTVDGENYDENNLPDNICQLEDGDYFDTDTDTADYCTINDEYYLCDDDRVVYCKDDNEHRLKDDCWKCTESGEWYSDDEESVELDGETYHADSVKALRDAEQVAPLFAELV